MLTGGNTAGSAADARIGSTIGPEWNQRSAPVASEVATTWNGIRASSNVRNVASSSISRRRPVLSPRAWRPLRRSATTLVIPVAGKTSPLRRFSQMSTSRSAPASVGSPAIAAPLSAPTEHPTIMSGRTPWSNNARTIPTCTAPRLPPPPSTNAVVGRLLTLSLLRLLQATGNAPLASFPHWPVASSAPMDVDRLQAMFDRLQRLNERNEIEHHGTAAEFDTDRYVSVERHERELERIFRRG